MGKVQGMSPWAIAIGGLAIFALIMGIGRFAFTPILPMMQEDYGVTVAQGGWLASANYIGYLAGALAALRIRMQPGTAIRGGLLSIAVCTLAMGFEQDFVWWLILRVIPGFASAWVMVFFSAWALEKLAQTGRPDLAGVVYAGVGAGIVLAGLVCLVLTQLRGSSDAAWIWLGAVAFLIIALTWPVTRCDARAAVAQSPAEAVEGEIPGFWRLVYCYGAFGFGYIIPATFLPVMAKQILSDPKWFGLAWPVFGAAAVLSTLVAARASAVVNFRRIWVVGNMVMALGVLIPLALPDLLGISMAALCVGGTFMVNTMVGLQEGRRVAGAKARVLIGAMTAAFGIGQIIGPVLVSWLVRYEDGFAYALICSSVPLVLASFALFGAGDART